MRRLSGHDVACRVTGRGQVDVVLVHGIGMAGSYFAPLVRQLRASARVVVPDLPGFGDSPRPDAALSIADHAEVVVALVTEMGLRRPILVGHSMGAQVVTEVAAAHPRLAGAVVLVGPVVDPQARSAVRQAWRLVRDARHEPLPALARQLKEWLRCGPRWYAATLAPMLEYRLEDRLRMVGEPVVLVRGSKDPVCRADHLRRLAGLAPGARILQVPGAGHLAFERRPWQVADAVLGLTVRAGSAR